MKRTVRVVMLPTNEKAGKISMGNTSLKLDYHIFPMEKGGIYTNHTYQHLYFLSDEEIKEGDWMLHNLDEKPIQWNGEETNPSVYGYKKIIATTDTSLRLTEIVKEDDSIEFPYITSLPQPSQSFIEKFVEEYNKGNVITEVMVEYEVDDGYMEVKSYLKVNSKDNTITIRKAKDSWSTEEMRQKLNDYRMYAKNSNLSIEMFDKWIEENL